MAEALRAKFPPVYAPFFSDLFDRAEIVESRATCSDCAMCDKGGPAPVAMEYFKPDLKCCTYHPYLPNYLIGAVFADPSPELEEGRRRLRAKIAARIGVTPRWIAPPRKYTVLTEAAQGSGFFGRSKAALCPYFDASGGGRCTVWKYRDNICSTYFCKYTSGKPGFDFWTAMKGYLGHVEKTLSRHAALAVDPSINYAQVKQSKLTPEDLDDLPPPDYASYWGQWVGREEEFYIACYESVRGMLPEDFSKIVDGTSEGAAHLDDVRARYEAIGSGKLPASLIRNPKMREHHAGDNIVVTTYSLYDSFSLEKDLYEVLGMLRGEETVEQNLARLLAEHEIELAPELLQYLFVHGVLVAPAAAKPVARCATTTTTTTE